MGQGNGEKKISELSTLQLAYTASRLRTELRDVEVLRSEPIAIVGMACRFPGGGNTPEAYWELLESGRDALRPLPPDRRRQSDSYDALTNREDKIHSTRGGYLDDDVFAFDHEFFGISAVEARAMDPQQRLLLEVSWEALEEAGIPAAKLKGTQTGVFVGIGLSDYAGEELRVPNAEHISPYSLTGSQFSVAAGRLSYFLGLRGPNLALDTACSSSLASVHLAVRSLRSGECETALAGGVNLILSPEVDIALSRAGVLSPTGACRSFDAAADGYARGEGCGIFVLKRLADAVREDNRVLAVIRGSAMNHGGASAGLTVPSATAQEDLIRRALRDSGVEPEQVSYLEAHGTGTPLGDPLEAKAASGALVRDVNRTDALKIGTAKSCIGHLETAAGAAGLMKTVLALRKHRIPGQVGFQEPNPRIDWTGISLASESTSWNPDGRRIAGVSSFGISGTNVHLLVEEAPSIPGPESPDQEKSEPVLILPIAAQDEVALKTRMRDYQEVLRANPKQAEKIARYAARHGNHHGDRRAACVATTGAELAEQLQTYGDQGDGTGVLLSPTRRRTSSPTFVFSGQAPGRNFKISPSDFSGTRNAAFRETLRECDAICRETAGWSILEFMDNPAGREGRTEFTQPMLFASQTALTHWWSARGVQPGAVLGHSAGEIAAAHAAGILNIKDAMRLAILRGRVLENIPVGGRMVAAAMSADEAHSLPWVLAKQLTVAVINSPTSIVLSGAESDVLEFQKFAGQKNIFAKLLPGAYAFHSPFTHSAARELAREIEKVNFNAPRLAFYSTLTGGLKNGDFNPEYFERQINEPVAFAETVSTLPEQFDVFLEMGPHPMLTEYVAELRPEAVVVGSLNAKQNHDTALAMNLGRLYAAGFEVSWEKIYPGFVEHVSLPPYPWTRVHLRSQAKPQESVGKAAGEKRAETQSPEKEQVVKHSLEPDRRAYLNSLLSRETAKLLGSPENKPPDPRRGFFQMGMDSIMAVQLAQVLSRELGETQSRALIFQHGNIHSLAEHLARKYPESSLDAASPPEPSPVALPIAPTITKMSHEQDGIPEPIAIVGMGCRFPGGADTPEKFWELLRNGVEAVHEFPSHRLDLNNFHDERPGTPGKVVTRRAALLDQVDEFDAAFFNISPREAAEMDPQQRILLETTWEALEYAGMVVADLRESKTGVFVGMTTNDYYHLQAARGDWNTTNAYSASGTLHSVAAGRISYLLGLRGPNLAVDTACSSALTAVHLACESLRRGESETALAGGVNLILSPESTLSMSMLRALSPHGRCRTFDASADGYVRGEGCGMIVLKKLSVAESSGDEILAVIRGSEINHDGPASGLTVPNGTAQRELLSGALTRANIAPHQVDYIEAHGTGTPLGDPIEFDSIADVYGDDPERPRPLLVGSVKTNVGHLESAAGMAGLFKVVLSLRNRAIPPHLHLRELNPDIQPDRIPARIPRELTPWDGIDGERIAGLNSFGMSGTNAHLLLGEAPPREKAIQLIAEPSPVGTPRLLTLSARSEPALREMAARTRALLIDSTNENSDGILDSLVYSAAVHRDHHEQRMSATTDSIEKMSSLLEACSQGHEAPGLSMGAARANRRLVFVFSGHGSQWTGMGLELLRTEPIFRRTLEEFDAFIHEITGWSLLAKLKLQDPGDFSRADTSQPILFSIQCALNNLWVARGIEPDAVLGQSMGEVAAAYCAGALSMRDAARIIVLRGDIASRDTIGGAMAMVALAPEKAQELVSDYGERATIAMYTSPKAAVLSGDVSAIDDILRKLERRRVFHRRIAVPFAGHTKRMDPYRDEMISVLKDLRPRTAGIPIYSPTDREILSGPEMDAEYWWRNLRLPVRFMDMTVALLRKEFDLFLEISPHPVAASSLQETFKDHGFDHAMTMGSLERDKPSLRSLRESLGRLYCAGLTVNWRAFYAEGGQRINLPGYPWQREKFWFKNDSNSGKASEFTPLGPALEPVGSPGLIARNINLDPDRLMYLNDHRVLGTPILPATMYLELAAAAYVQEEPCELLRLEKIEFLIPFPLGDDERQMQLNLYPPDNGLRRFEFHGRENRAGQWTLHARGFARRASTSDEDWRTGDRLGDDAFQVASEKPFAPDEFYGALARIGMEYGPAFRGIESLAFARGTGNTSLAHALIRSPDVLAHHVAHSTMHPALLDACFHSQAALISSREDVEAVLPMALDSITMRPHMPPTPGVFVRATAEETSDSRLLRGDVIARTEDGEVAFIARGLQSRLMMRDTDADLDGWSYIVHWETVEAEGQSPLNQGDWVILTDGVIGESCAEKIVNRGGRVLMIRPGEETHSDFLKIGNQSVQATYLNPTSENSVARIKRTLTGFQPDGVLHLWGVRGPTDESQMAEYAMNLCLSARLMFSILEKNSSIYLVTAGAASTNSREEITLPAAATLWGLGRVARNEYANIDCRLLDLDSRNPEKQTELLFHATAGNESEIALRGRKLRAPRLRRMPFTARAPRESWTPGAPGTVLITGGLGGLGLLAAERLSASGVSHLVLVGRSAPSHEVLKTIEIMIARGTSVRVLKADISSWEQTLSLPELAEQDAPPLRGVLHLAGILRDGLLANLKDDDFRAVMDSKVRGTMNLEKALVNRSLDFFILFSSAAALLGTSGQANYAAANAYLDAVAQKNRTLGRSTLSIGWGPFSETGLAVRDGRGGKLLMERGMGSIPGAEGMRALERFILAAADASHGGHIALMPFRVDAWSEYYPRARSSSLLRELAKRSDSQGPDLRSLLAGARTPGERSQLLLDHLREQTALLLRLPADGVDSERTFGSMGFDSLTTLEMRNRLDTSLGLALPASVLWNYPTPRSLLLYLLESLGFEQEEKVAPNGETIDEEALPPKDAPALEEMSTEEIAELLRAELEQPSHSGLLETRRGST